MLQSSPFVDNICLHAEATKSFTVALIVPNEHSLEEWAKKKGVDASNFESLCGNKDAEAEVLKSISRVSGQ